MSFVRVVWVGLLIMVGYFIAMFLGTFLNGLIIAFVPSLYTGTFGLVGLILSIAISAFLLGAIILFLLKRFGG